ncbi:translocation/assembly module TamB domain-containing protein [Alcanivorax quisquiliarum]|uniref:Translocation/assembly module TamB domain-containing protein n=1 Tax=Alcanivorax quisquiliarum TaxID=2933565 RepID=A0ABT0E964_9GAMM|nr:translocation/assembly module TamB domain-containing protein [Alcanivorax quisquiliarum]MCK0538184.1 translocation/assembly module TamB domain-containing protein [Alcanivorax quisquiliarum]
MIRLWLRRLLILAGILVLLLVIALPLALGIAMSREAGSRWLLVQAAAYAPGELHMDSVQGTFLRGLDVYGVHYHLSAVTIEADRLQLALAWPALLQRRVNATVLKIDALAITMHGTETEATPADDTPFGLADLPDIRLPVEIAIPAGEVNGFTFTPAGGTPIRLDQILLAGSTSADHQLHLQQLLARQGDYHASLNGRLGLLGPFPLDAWLDWQAPLPAAAAEALGTTESAHGEARLQGDAATLRLRHRLRAPLALETEGQLAPFAAPLRFELANQWAPFTLHLPPGSDGAATEEPGIEGTITENTGTESAHTDGEDNAGSEGNEDKNPEDSNPARTLAVAGGTLAVAGSPDAYQLQLASGTQLPDLPALTFTLAAEGSTQGLQVQEATVQAGQATAQLRGEIEWAPLLRWDLALAVQEFDPSLILPELPGTLALRAQTQGQLRESKLALAVELKHLSGTLRGQPVGGSGSVALSDTMALESDLQLRAGRNRVSLRGRAAETLDIRLDIVANQLSALWPGLRGQLHLDGRLHGTRALPRLDATANGQSLGFGAWQLARLALQAGASDPLNEEAAQLDLHLTLDDLQHGTETLLDSAELRGRGSAADHRLHWQLSAPGDGLFNPSSSALSSTNSSTGSSSLSGAVQGALHDLRAWQGQLQSLAIDNPLAGQWQLEQPAALALSTSAAQLARACLVSDGGRLCAEGQWQSDGASQARLDLDTMPLAWLARALPDDAAAIDGSLSLHAEYHRQRGGQAQAGSARLTISPGSLTLASGDDDPYQIRWQGADITATLENTRLDARATLHLDDDNRAQARLGAALAGPQTRLDGALDILVDELRWLELFIPQARQITGRIRGNLVLGGTIAAPVFSGQLRLEQGGTEIPDLGLALTDLNLLVGARPDGTLDVSGAVRSGPGQLGISGTLATRGPQPWPLQLAIQGERFQAVQTPEARVLINPDITVELRGNQLVIRGDILVPEAQFEINTLPQQAVTTSSDEIIVSEDIEQTSPWDIDTEVTVRLGELITFEGFGLSARFGGGVRIEDKPERSTRLTGEVRILDGRYRAYGQNLRVERGTLIFQGAPDNPGLDIVAVRTIPAYDVRAGLIVGGTLQDPRSQVFSEPAMEETEAMAYLLTGRPLNRASDNDANMIVQAIARYGIERGEFITDRLGQTLGLEVGVDTEGEFEDTALMLGKQLSSRLYLRYSVGLFEALSTVMLRYTLTSSLSLETRSNAEEQAIDLIFRTER